MWLFWSLVAFISALALHAWLCRAPWVMNRVFRFLVIGIPLGLIVMAGMFSFYGLATEAVAAVFLYAFLSELYIFLFASIGTSVSVSLLLTLKGPGKDAREIESSFRSDHMVETRLDAMTREGLLVKMPTDYTLTPKGRLLVGVFRGMQSLFGHDQGEGLAARSSKA